MTNKAEPRVSHDELPHNTSLPFQSLHRSFSAYKLFPWNFNKTNATNVLKNYREMSSNNSEINIRTLLVYFALMIINASRDLAARLFTSYRLFCWKCIQFHKLSAPVTGGLREMSLRTFARTKVTLARMYLQTPLYQERFSCTVNRPSKSWTVVRIQSLILSRPEQREYLGERCQRFS